jgi:uncharacterized circularly permuted ATP-grasp superfamily protein
MNTIAEAARYYNSLLLDDPALAAETQAELAHELEQRNLYFGDRPVCNVLRPRFITRRAADYVTGQVQLISSALVKTFDALLTDQQLRNVLDLTPSEEESIRIEPGYRVPVPLSRLDSLFDSAAGSLHFIEYNAETPAGVGYQDALLDVFGNLRVMTSFGMRYVVERPLAESSLLDTLLACFAEAGGPDDVSMAIIDWDGVATAPEHEELARYFREAGVATVVGTPDDVTYARGVMHVRDTAVNLIYKRVICAELLERVGMQHPIVQAVRDRAAVMVNSFRCKLLHKKAVLAILSDPEYERLYHSRELQAIREHVPWTRRLREGSTIYGQQTVDLVEFAVSNRERLVLKPNDAYGGAGVTIGRQASQAEWERSLQAGLSASYVLQAHVQLPSELFPYSSDRGVDLVDLGVDLNPFVFEDSQVHGYLSRVSASPLLNVTAGTGSVVPTFLIDVLGQA